MNLQDQNMRLIPWPAVLLGGLAIVTLLTSPVLHATPTQAELIAERLRPVGRVVVSAEQDALEASSAEAAAAADEGEPAATPVESSAVAPAAQPTPPRPAATGSYQVPEGIDMAAGEAVYVAACIVCHAQGVAGAPRFGDTALWNERVNRGWDALAHSVLNGLGAMPPKGGRIDLSDEDILNAMAYMIAESR